MPKNAWELVESDMDQTSRLILMMADDEGRRMDIANFAAAIREIHPDTNILIIMNQWKKYRGSTATLPTHDYKTGEKRKGLR